MICVAHVDRVDRGGTIRNDDDDCEYQQQIFLQWKYELYLLREFTDGSKFDGDPEKSNHLRKDHSANNKGDEGQPGVERRYGKELEGQTLHRDGV